MKEDRELDDQSLYEGWLKASYLPLVCDWLEYDEKGRITNRCGERAGYRSDSFVFLCGVHKVLAQLQGTSVEKISYRAM